MGFMPCPRSEVHRDRDRSPVTKSELFAHFPQSFPRTGIFRDSTTRGLLRLVSICDAIKQNESELEKK